jgi:hypothetical protein
MSHSIDPKRLITIFLFIFLIVGSSLWTALAQDDALPQDDVLPLPGASGSSRDFTELDQLTASDSAAGAFFGIDVALDGKLILVSSYQTDGAYIFERSPIDTWEEVIRLEGVDTVAGDYFGYDVAIQGDIAVVGAPLADVETSAEEGVVYIFTRETAGTWTQWQKLTVVGLPASSAFGADVDIDGDRIVVAARNVNRVYIYKRNASLNWQYETDIELGNDVGDVKLEGDTLLMGVSTEGTYTGASYLYQLQAGSWTFVKKLLASDGVPDDNFGLKVALRDGQAFVFAPLIASSDSQGAVYVFSESGGTWIQTQKLAPNDPDTNDNFGFGLDVDGDHMAIGSNGDGTSAGSIYLFSWNGSAWLQQDKIPAVGSRFGYAVDLQNTLLVGSAPYFNSNAGKVYVYDNPDLLPTATPTITNTPPPLTETPQAGDELLVNGGFENGDDGWTVKNAAGDKVKCNKEGKNLAHSGNCGWRFKGGADENTKLQQTITSGLEAGDTLTLSGFVRIYEGTAGKVKVIIKYLDQTVPKSKITVEIHDDLFGFYMPLSDFQPVLTIPITAAPEKVKVMINNTSNNANTYYDTLSLIAQ